MVEIGQSSGNGHVATLKGLPIATFIWHPYRSNILLLGGGKLFEADPANPRRANWMDITPRGLKNWRLEAFPDRPDGRMVVASNDRDPAALDLFTVQQDGSDLQLLEQNSDTTVGWLLDSGGSIGMRVDRTSDGGAQYFLREEPDGECFCRRDRMSCSSR